jgi:ADP-heptose:LPS heptosyltransferase
VGLVTRGSPTHRNDAHRSLPDALAAELRAAPGAVSLHPEDSGARDLQETAEIIAGLDLVVTVDTAVAHLAGSLGKPTWVLLPAHGCDWRWLRDRLDSPWYPSVRLYRQAAPGGWSEVVAAVRRDLANSPLPSASRLS